MSEKLSNPRCRTWAMLFYPDDQSHQKAMEIIRNTYPYVAILHEHDIWTSEDEKENPDHKAGELKKAHWHIVLRFPEARYKNALAKELGVKENYLQVVKVYKSACLYLLHKGWPEKYQYPPDLLEGPLKEQVLKWIADSDECSRVKEIIDLIDGMEFIDYSQLVRTACEKGLYADLRRMGHILSRIVDSHNGEYWEKTKAMERYARDRQQALADLGHLDAFMRFVSDKSDDIQPIDG